MQIEPTSDMESLRQEEKHSEETLRLHGETLQPTQSVNGNLGSTHWLRGRISIQAEKSLLTRITFQKLNPG